MSIIMSLRMGDIFLDADWLSLDYLIAVPARELDGRDALSLLFNVFLMHALAQKLYLLLGSVHSSKY